MIPPQPGAVPLRRGAVLLCALLFAGTVINYMDRQVLGLLKSDLSRDLGWDEYDYAHVVMAFQAAYALGYVVCGRLVDALGGGRVLPGAAAVWSLATALHAVCLATWQFLAARFVLGLAEGANFPAAIRLVGEAFPPARRALAVAVVLSGSGVGAILCPFLAAGLAAGLGWRGAFAVLGALGLVWLAAWWGSRRLLPLGPEDAPLVEAAPAALPWRDLLRLRWTWAYLLASLIAGPVWWFYLFWIPDFLQRRFHATLDEVKLPIAAIYAASLVGGMAGGWLSGRLVDRGLPPTRARKAVLLAAAAAVLPVALAPWTGSLPLTVGIIALAAAAHQAWSANLQSLTIDIMPTGSVSSLVGLGGFLCGLASLGTAQAVAAVVTATGGYQILFWWAATAYLLSFALLHLLIRSRSHASDLPASR